MSTFIGNDSIWVIENRELWIHSDSRWMHFEGRFAEAARRALQGGNVDPVIERLIATGAPGTELLAPALAPKNVRSMKQSLLVHEPSLLFVELTNHCNLMCRHCYGNAGPKEDETMAPETAVTLIREAAALAFQRVQLTGGEPLLYPRLSDLVRLAFDEGVPAVEIFTNGTTISRSFLGELPSKTLFALSFYSHDSEVHDRITKVPGSGRATLRAIDLLLEQGFDVRVSTIIMEENAADWEETKAFLEERGIDNGRMSAGSTSTVGRGSYFPAPKDEVPACSDDGEVKKNDRPVFRWPGKAAVTSGGDVYPCIFARWAVLGNIHNRPLTNILSRPRSLDGERLSVPERWEYCASRLSCPDCRLLLFGMMGAANE